MGKRTAKSIHLTGRGGRRATKIKDIEGVTKNCFTYLPLAVPFSVMCLMYVEGVSSSVISIISLVLLKWKHHISVLVTYCRRMLATLLKCCFQEKETSQLNFSSFWQQFGDTWTD